MSIARAFTTRRNKPEMEISAPMYIGRAASQRGGKPIYRTQISSPVALVSTSNMQVHHAEHIAGTSAIEIRSVSGSSTISSSSDDSDAGTGSIHSNETITDASSVDESPMKTEPEPNHLSCYFKPAVDTCPRSPTYSPSHSARPSFDTPTLPQRVPSHSKKAHERVHRKRSIQRVMSPTRAPPETGAEISRSSLDVSSPTRSAFVEAPRENPFGKELAQLDAVAEEFGQVVKSAEAQADAVYLHSRSLASFTADDYVAEISDLIFEAFYQETPVSALDNWI